MQGNKTHEYHSITVPLSKKPNSVRLGRERNTCTEQAGEGGDGDRQAGIQNVEERPRLHPGRCQGSLPGGGDMVGGHGKPRTPGNAEVGKENEWRLLFLVKKSQWNKFLV